MNRETAVTQYGLGATNQVTPWGNLSYSQIGKWADGTPRFQATQTFSPENQKIFDNYTALSGKLGTIGNTLGDNVAGTLGQPFKLGNEETEGRLMELGRSRLDPLYQERQSSLENQLVNSGIRRGSAAWNSATQKFGDQRSRDYNDLLLSGRSLADQELTQERNQPLNELTALLNGSQVQQPGYTNTPQPGVAGVDYAGLVQSNYQNQLNQYNQSQQNKMAGLGGLFKLGSAAIGGFGGWGA